MPKNIVINPKYYNGEKQLRRSEGIVCPNGNGFKAEYRVCGIKASVKTFISREKAEEYLHERIAVRNEFYDRVESGELSPVEAEAGFIELIKGNNPLGSGISAKSSFSDYCNYYVDTYLKKRCENRANNIGAKVVSYNRVRDCQGFISNHISDSSIGNMKICELKSIYFNAFAHNLQNKGLSNKTVKNVLQFCHQVLDRSVDEDLISKNPVSMDMINEMVNNGKRKKEPEVYSEQEASAIISAAYNNSLVKGCLFELFLSTGVRRGEALGVRFGDIDIEKRKIHIRRSVIRKSNLSHVEGISKTKTEIDFNSPLKTASSDRWVDIPDSLVDNLKKLRGNKDAAEYCFTDDKGKIINPDYVSHILKKLADAAGVRVIKVHELRNTFATNSYLETKDIDYVRSQLGHTTQAMTRQYIVQHNIDE